jgi:hypothetical protein
MMAKGYANWPGTTSLRSSSSPVGCHFGLGSCVTIRSDRLLAIWLFLLYELIFFTGNDQMFFSKEIKIDPARIDSFRAKYCFTDSDLFLDKRIFALFEPMQSVNEAIKICKEDHVSAIEQYDPVAAYLPAGSLHSQNHNSHAFSQPLAY